MREWQFEELLTTLHDRVRPAPTAVIVVDMQNDYVSPGGAAALRDGTVADEQAIVAPLQLLLAAARAAGVLVVYLQMTYPPDQRLASEIDYLRVRHRWGDGSVVVRGTWGHGIIAELTPGPDDVIVEKQRTSGFIGTNVDLVLRSNRIRSVVVTGVVSHGCVNATARDALSHEYYVTVASDCVASNNAELHNATMFLLERYIALEDGVVPSQRICEEWDRWVAASPADGRAYSGVAAERRSEAR